MVALEKAPYRAKPVQRAYHDIKQKIGTLPPAEQMNYIKKAYDDSMKRQVDDYKMKLHEKSNSGSSPDNVDPYKGVFLSGFRNLLSLLGVSGLDDDSSYSLFKKFDLSGDGFVSFDNFITGILIGRQHRTSKPIFIPTKAVRPAANHHIGDLPKSLSNIKWSVEKLRVRLAGKLHQHCGTRHEQYRLLNAMFKTSNESCEDILIDPYLLNQIFFRFSIVASIEDAEALIRKISGGSQSIRLHQFVTKINEEDYRKKTVVQPHMKHKRNLKESVSSVLQDPVGGAEDELLSVNDDSDVGQLRPAGFSVKHLISLIRTKVEERIGRSDAEPSSELWKAFLQFDSDRDGIMTKPELEMLLKYFSFTVHEQDFETLYEFLSDPIDNRIHWEDFSVKIFPPDTSSIHGGSSSRDFFSRNFNHADNPYMDDYAINVHNIRDEPDRDLMQTGLFSPEPGTPRREADKVEYKPSLGQQRQIDSRNAFLKRDPGDVYTMIPPPKERSNSYTSIKSESIQSEPVPHRRPSVAQIKAHGTHQSRHQSRPVSSFEKYNVFASKAPRKRSDPTPGLAAQLYNISEDKQFDGPAFDMLSRHNYRPEGSIRAGYIAKCLSEKASSTKSMHIQDAVRKPEPGKITVDRDMGSFADTTKTIIPSAVKH